MRSWIRVSILALSTVSALLSVVHSLFAATSDPKAPLLTAPGLPGAIRAVGSRAPTEAEVKTLAAVLGRASLQQRAGEFLSDFQMRQQAAEVEAYLTNNPVSPYNPSLRVELGRYYAGQLHVGRALEHWRKVGDDLGAATDPGSREYGDMALALYARALLINGNIEELRAFYQVHAARPTAMGPLGAHWLRTAEKFQSMERIPEQSFKCGVYALDELGQILGLSYSRAQLTAVPASASGFGLGDLVRIGASFGIGVSAYVGSTNIPPTAPALLHLRDSHYVVLTRVQGEVVTVFDPGRKDVFQLPWSHVAEEFSGYFLAPTQPMRPGWRLASAAEQRDVRGRNSSCPPEDDEDGDCEDGGGDGGNSWWNDSGEEGGAPEDCNNCGEGETGGEGSGSSCGSGGCGSNGAAKECEECEGMMTWRVTEPYGGLILKDSPLRYRPSKGPYPSPKIYYKLYNEGLHTRGFNGLGDNWNLNALGRCEELNAVIPYSETPNPPIDYYDQVSVQLPSGAVWKYRFKTTASWPAIIAAEPTARRSRSWSDGGSSVLYRQGRSGPYVLELSSGRKITFGLLAYPGSSTWMATEYLNRRQYKLTANFSNVTGQTGSETDTKLVSLTDGDGRVTQFTYAYDAYMGSPLLASMTSPDGRTASFTWSSGRLASVTDPAGVVSQVGYGGQYGVLSSLTTPYGTTQFYRTTAAGFPVIPDGFSGAGGFDRWMYIIEPNGSRQLFGVNWGYTSAFPDTFSPGQLPGPLPDPDTGVLSGGSGSTVDITDRSSRNSYHWGRQQMAAILGQTGLAYNVLNAAEWTVNEFYLARTRHWLAPREPFAAAVSSALSWEQMPGAQIGTQGPIYWFDYAGKNDPTSEGLQPRPAVVAWKLPDTGTMYWRYTQWNDFGRPLLKKSIYSDPATGLGAERTTAIYQYSAASGAWGGNLVWILDGQSRPLKYFEWNTARRVTKKREWHTLTTNPSDTSKYYETTYTYDTTQRLTQRVEPTGLTTTWTYTPGGNNASYTVTEQQSPVLIAGVSGSRSETRVITDGRLTSHTDWRGLTRTFLYDGLDRLLRTTWPDTTYSEVSYTRTVGGQPQVIMDPVTIRDRLGKVTTYGYDGLRRRIAITDARNNTTSISYCDCGSVSQVTDPLGNKTIYAYDLAGRHTSTEIRKPDNTVVATTTFGYDLLGRATSEVDASGTRTLSYNHQGLRIGTWQDSKLLGRTIYNADDLPATVVDRNGVVVTQAFDLMGRMTSRAYPTGASETFSYSARGLTQHVSELAKTTTYAYDAGGRKTSEVTPNSETVSYTYNAAGELLTLTDGRGKVTTWTYDNEGRVWRKRYAGDAFDQIVYSYYADGSLNSRRYYSNATTYQETLYTYDNNGNVTLVNYPSGTTDIALIYDANNRVTSMTDAAGTTTYTYTAWGAPLTEDGPWTSTTDLLTYAYDTARRRTGATLSQPGGGTFATTYWFDVAGRMNSVISPAGATTYGYLSASYGGNNYAADRRTLIDLPGTFQIDQNFTDPLKRLMSTALKNVATVVNSHSYVYNNGSQRTKQTLTDSSYVDYAYDNLGQLDTALTKTSGGAAVSGQQFDYGYDAGWNMTNRATGAGTSAYTVNDRNQATSVAAYAQSYNAMGNRIQEMTGTTTSLNYAYDAENQLISVATDTYGTPDGYRWKMEFVYDGRGRMRIRKDYIWLTGAWYLNGEQRYVYDGMRLLQQRSSGNVPQVSYTRGLDLSESLEGAGGIGGLLARSTHATTSPYAVNSSAYYHADGNGNITYLLRSDAAANASYKYDPFGRLLSSSGTLAAANVLRFSSKPILLSSLGTWGDYYYGYRFYDPESQRWLNRDPILENGGGNIYGFVGNDPNNRLDPYGLLHPGGILINVAIGTSVGEIIAGGVGAGALCIGLYCAIQNPPPPSPVTYPNFGPRNAIPF